MCPLKDPTYIVNKTICENVMQHNNLFGKTNKNYNKNIDLPTTQPKPKKAIIPSQAHSTTTVTIEQPHNQMYMTSIHMLHRSHPSKIFLVIIMSHLFYLTNPLMMISFKHPLRSQFFHLPIFILPITWKII
jgi:hypothetical protein